MANTVSAQGQLRHHFWGNYFATVAIVFENEQAALDALKILGKPWKQSQKAKRVLGCSVNTEELEVLKDQLAKYGADKTKIDSVAKSIDHGEIFHITIPIVSKEQLKFEL